MGENAFREVRLTEVKRAEAREIAEAKERAKVEV